MRNLHRSSRPCSLLRVPARYWLCVGLIAASLHALADEAAWRTSLQAGADAQQRGNLADAVRQFEAAAGEAEAFGDDNWRLAGSLFNLGQALHARGRMADAAERLDEALSVYRRAFGPHSEPGLEVLEAKARLHRDWGRAAMAESSVREAVAEIEALHGETHPRSALALARLADLLADAGRHREAATIATRAADSMASDQTEPAAARLEAGALLARVATAGARYPEAGRLVTSALEDARALDKARAGSH